MKTYSLSDATAITPTPAGGVEFLYQGHKVAMNLPGKHMVSNAVGVFTVGQLLGFSVEQLIPGVSSFSAGDGRWQKELAMTFSKNSPVRDTAAT